VVEFCGPLQNHMILGDGYSCSESFNVYSPVRGPRSRGYPLGVGQGFTDAFTDGQLGLYGQSSDLQAFLYGYGMQSVITFITVLATSIAYGLRILSPFLALSLPLSTSIAVR
jgi:hypothetical protein